jgi:hypothetical protein
MVEWQELCSPSLRQLIRVKEQYFGTVDLMFSASLASETAGIRLNALDLGAARNAETGDR